MNISVVIPLYNKSYSIQRALTSVLYQSYLPSEVIVIDDGSSDDSYKQVEEFICSSKIKIIKLYSIENSGVSFARNYGVNKTTSEYIAFLDADDQWLENHLLDKINLIRKNPTAGIFSSRHSFISNGQVSIAKNPFIYDFNGVVDDFFIRSIRSSIANSSKVVVNKQHFIDVGGFLEGVFVAEDLHLWINLASKYDVMYSSEITVNIFVEHDESRTSRQKKIPYPLNYYSKKNISKSLKLYLRTIFIKHYLSYILSGEYKMAVLIYNKSISYFKFFDFLYILLFLVPPKILYILILLSGKTYYQR